MIAATARDVLTKLVWNRGLAAMTVVAAVASPAAGQSTATLLNGRLVVTAPPTGDRAVKVEVGPAAGFTRLQGFPGIADGTSYSGVTALTIVTGAGRDTVEVSVQAAQSLALRIDTGAGDAETKIAWQVLRGVARAAVGIDIDSVPGGSQLASIEVDSEVRDTTVDIDTGHAREVAAKVLADDAADFVGVSYAGTAPKTQVEVVADASRLQVALRGNYFQGPSELGYVIGQLRPGTALVDFDVTLGDGSDKVEATVAASGSRITTTGAIRGGGGDDLIAVKTGGLATTSGLTMAGQDGNDQLFHTISGEYQMSQTLAPRFLGGNGNDQLRLDGHTLIRGTGLPNDASPLIDGGAGFDLYWGFGIIRNCEGRF